MHVSSLQSFSSSSSCTSLCLSRLSYEHDGACVLLSAYILESLVSRFSQIDVSIIGQLVEDSNARERNVRFVAAVVGGSLVPLSFHLKKNKAIGSTIHFVLCTLLQTTGEKPMAQSTLLTRASCSGLHQGKTRSNRDLNSHRNRLVCHHGIPCDRSPRETDFASHKDSGQT